MNKDWILKTDLKSPHWGEEEQTSRGAWEAEACAWEKVVHSRGRLKFSVPLNHPQACMQSTCWWDEEQGVPFGWCPPMLQTIWPGSAAARSFLC